jgi:Condensation domain
MGVDRFPALSKAAVPAGAPGWNPALPAQRGMILNYLRFPDDGVDVIQVTLDWTSPLEREPFEAAWHLVARRHEVLRTAFRLDDGAGFVQVIDPDASIDIRWRDLPPPPASGPDHPFESFLRADRRERFDPTHRPPVRLTIVRRVASSDGWAAGSSAHRAVLTFHHALLDGRSLRLLVEEASAVYAARLAGRAAPEPPRPPFHEFVRWWQTTDPSASQQFWTEYLAGAVVSRPLPGYLGEQVAGTAEPMAAETVLSRADSELIRRAASITGLSSSTMVSATWALLRARYGGVADVLIAVTRSCVRDSIPGADAVIGPLINTVPLRVRVDERWSVCELVTAVNDGIRQIREHQRTPMGSALAWAGLPADTALLDSLLMFDRRGLQASLAGGDGVPSSARVDRLPSYPLMLCAFDEPQLRLSFNWDRCRFADGSVQPMLDQLRETLIELANNLSKPLADLALGQMTEPGTVAPRSAVAPASIGRRDRGAYRVAAPAVAPASIGRRESVLAPHLVRLTDDWALWRSVCLRGAGFPFDLVGALGDADLARAADAAIAAGAGDPDRLRSGGAGPRWRGLRRRVHRRGPAPVRGAVRGGLPAEAAGSGRLAEPARADDRHRRAGPPGA